MAGSAGSLHHPQCPFSQVSIDVVKLMISAAIIMQLASTQLCCAVMPAWFERRRKICCDVNVISSDTTAKLMSKRKRLKACPEAAMFLWGPQQGCR